MKTFTRLASGLLITPSYLLQSRTSTRPATPDHRITTKAETWTAQCKESARINATDCLYQLKKEKNLLIVKQVFSAKFTPECLTWLMFGELRQRLAAFPLTASCSLTVTSCTHTCTHTQRQGLFVLINLYLFDLKCTSFVNEEKHVLILAQGEPTSIC